VEPKRLASPRASTAADEIKIKIKSVISNGR